MRIQRAVPRRFILFAILVLVCSSGLVRGQGGTGKMPPSPSMPPLRMPPSPPMRRMPPPRTDLPPEKRKVRTDIYVVPNSASGSLSIQDRLPEALGDLSRNKLETNVSDFTNKDHGAVEVLRAEYGNDLLIFLSRFEDAASANKTMQALAKKVAGTHSTISRKQIKNAAGKALGEFLLLKSSGREQNVHLLATNGSYLYRVYGDNSEDVQKAFKSLPLE